MPDLATIKAGQQQVWSSGNYAVIGSGLLYVSEHLVESMEPRGGQRLLDVACGTGNATLAGARRACKAVGVDYVPEFLEYGRQKAAAEHLDAEFVVGDAEDLPFEDDSFDLAVSVAGCMFAPDQQRTADEMLRVVRPGGKIGLACWEPVGLSAEFFQFMGSLRPPAPELQSPLRWGTRDGIKELFGDRAEEIRTESRKFIQRASSVDAYVTRFAQNFPLLASTLPTLPADERARVVAEFTALNTRVNEATDGSYLAPLEYLQTIVVKAQG